MAGTDDAPASPPYYGELRAYGDRLRDWFRLPVPSAPGAELKAEVRGAALALAVAIARSSPYSTESACAMRRLMEAVMWTEASIDRDRNEGALR